MKDWFKRRKVMDCYRAAFDTKEGKVVLDDLVRTFAVQETTFSPDPQQFAFNEGARSVVMRILKTINTDPEVAKKMMEGQLEEHNEF